MAMIINLILFTIIQILPVGSIIHAMSIKVRIWILVVYWCLSFSLQSSKQKEGKKNRERRNELYYYYMLLINSLWLGPITTYIGLYQSCASPSVTYPTMSVLCQSTPPQREWVGTPTRCVDFVKYTNSLCRLCQIRAFLTFRSKTRTGNDRHQATNSSRWTEFQF